MANVAQKYVELDKEITDALKEYRELSELYNRTSFEVQLKRQALEAFSEAIKMFEDQMKLQEKFQKEAQPHEISTWVFVNSYVPMHFRSCMQICRLCL